MGILKELYQIFKDDLLLELEINFPPTNYGYWITDTGEVLAVNNSEGHLDMIRNMLGSELMTREAYSMALQKGWIRIVLIRSSGGLEAEATTPTIVANAVYKQLVKQRDELAKAQKKNPTYYVVKSRPGVDLPYGRAVITDKWVDSYQKAQNFFRN